HLAVLKRMQREKVPVRTGTLTRWLGEERGEEAIGAILDAIRGAPAVETREALEVLVCEKAHSTANRLRALALFADGLDPPNPPPLIRLTRMPDEGPVLAALLRQFGRHPKLDTAARLTSHTTSKAPEVRAAAIEALAELGAAEGKDAALKLLADREPEVQRAA